MVDRPYIYTPYASQEIQPELAIVLESYRSYAKTSHSPQFWQISQIDPDHALEGQL